MSAATKPQQTIEPDPSAPFGVATALRTHEERTRALALDAQMAECVDLLQTPEIVIEDVLRSVAEIREAAEISDRPRMNRVEILCGGVESDGPDDPRFIYPARELFVQGDRCSFTCLATEVDFRESARESAPESERVPASEEVPAICLASRATSPIDFAAVTCESKPFPVLGFSQQIETESAYPILLRGLASLIELTRPRRFEALDRDVYRGLLGPAPVFDLALVLWDDEETADPRRPLCELTRDLAEILKGALVAEPRFPPILNDIVCLRLNNKRFDGRLRYVWRI